MAWISPLATCARFQIVCLSGFGIYSVFIVRPKCMVQLSAERINSNTDTLNLHFHVQG